MLCDTGEPSQFCLDTPLCSPACSPLYFGGWKSAAAAKRRSSNGYKQSAKSRTEHGGRNIANWTIFGAHDGRINGHWP